MADIVQTIFSVISSAVTSFVSTLTSAISGVTELFYIPAGTGESSGHMTFLGVLLLIAAGVGLVYWVFRLIKGLVQRA